MSHPSALAAAAALAALLAGCATLPDPADAPASRVVTVDKPIAVACREPVPEAPVWAMDAIAPDADIDTLMAAALAELEQRAGYEERLAAALANCRR